MIKKRELSGCFKKLRLGTINKDQDKKLKYDELPIISKRSMLDFGGYKV